MLRHRSTPCLWLATSTSTAAAVIPDANHRHHRGDDLEERYHNLQDQHLELKREANMAQDQLRALNTRLSRLLAEKKRFYRNVKNEREILMEERLFELERSLFQQQQHNERLRERIKLMRINPVNQSLQRPQSSSLTTTTNHRIQQQQRNFSASYSRVRSRTDSGLGFYFRPLNVSQKQPQHQLRPTSGSTQIRRARSQNDLRQVRFQEVGEMDSSPSLDDESTITNTLSTSQSQSLPFESAKALMQEAKEEIIRLETIVAKQQRIIDSLKHTNLENDDDGPILDHHHQYTTILTTTTTSTSTTATASGHVVEQPFSPSIIANGVSETSMNNETVESLWCKYQKIRLNKESFERVSQECHQLIERLYKTVKEERNRCQQLKTMIVQHGTEMSTATAPNDSDSQSAVTIPEKDKIIETLRKENMILQNSLKQCIEQCLAVMAAENGQNSETPANQNQIQQLWQIKRQKYEQQIIGLERKLHQMKEELNRQAIENDSLKLKYENLKQLNESDQLKIEHLEKKIQRLSKVLFYSEEDSKDANGEIQNPTNNNHDTTNGLMLQQDDDDISS